MKAAHIAGALAACFVLSSLAACDRVDNNSLPSYTVRINLSDIARWNVYGVSGVGDYRIFNRAKQLPKNFPYDVNTYTGYGGVLLMMALDINSTSTSYVPVAYDAACPVEKDADVTLSVDASNFDAVCPKCGSRYNVLTGAGGPISGEALNRKLGLTTYKVRASTSSGYIITSY